jgi:hypothetical protein
MEITLPLMAKVGRSTTGLGAPRGRRWKNDGRSNHAGVRARCLGGLRLRASWRQSLGTSKFYEILNIRSVNIIFV